MVFIFEFILKSSFFSSHSKQKNHRIGQCRGVFASNSKLKTSQCKMVPPRRPRARSKGGFLRRPVTANAAPPARPLEGRIFNAPCNCNRRAARALKIKIHRISQCRMVFTLHSKYKTNQCKMILLFRTSKPQNQSIQSGFHFECKMKNQSMQNGFLY